jgi:hypothetical protein
MLLMTIFQKYRLRSVFPSLQFINLEQVLTSLSLQSSNSEEARAFPSLMAPPPMHRCWTIDSISKKNAWAIPFQLVGDCSMAPTWLRHR